MTHSLLEQGIEAAQAGQRKQARALFARAVQEEPENEQAWLWLVTVVEDDWHKLYCLRQVQRLNPNHPTASRGVKALATRLEVPQTQRELPLAPSPPSSCKEDRGEQPVAVETPKPVVPPPRRLETLGSVGMFFVQRLIFGFAVLAVISFLSYLGLDMAGGTAIQAALTHATRETLSYLGRLARGDLGVSSAGGTTQALIPVAQVVTDTVLKSLGLLAVSMAIAVLIGVTLGLWAARRRHTGWSLMTLVASVAGVSLPSFFVALLLQLAAIRWTRTFGRALLPVGGFGWDKRIILPALVLAARPIAQIARVTFVSVGQLLDQDFVRTAHSKGLVPRLVMNRHVIRNAAIPILTTIGVSFRFSLSSLPVVEFFFSWPGVGFTLLKAISRRDDDLTVALILCLGTLFILVNLLLEGAYRLIDPRLRERVAQTAQQERESLLEIVRSALAGLGEWIVHWPLWRWFNKRKAVAEISPFRAVLQRGSSSVEVDARAHRAERRRAWIRGTVSNFPMIIGTVLVICLFFVFAFGSNLAPHSPYTTRGLEYSDGKLTVPPFAPDATYVWGTDPLGRDVLSLVMAGAQQTLLLATLVVVTRILVGSVLGALAGWLNGSWVDRLLIGAAEVIAAFPSLLLAMTLILALGIRQGMRPFVIALCFVGWGEIMQFVRGQVTAIRVRPFIESAVATGLRTPRILVSHVLPNLLSALISIAALEMGSVLMTLGELGFVGIFIGGGAFAELDVAGRPPYHYSDVPEWGALLSNIRLYARAYPWMAVYPAMAFFISILGFNLFGEGIRRMVERVGVGITRLVNRYTVIAAVLVALGVGWVRGNTGAIAFYRRQAAAFDGQRALAHVRALADPALEGRALRTKGLDMAAEYVVQQFESLGIQPGGEELGYFQHRFRSCETLDAVPELTIEGQNASLVYRRDYVEYPGRYRNMGAFRGRVRLVTMGELIPTRTWSSLSYRALEDVVATDKVVLLLSGQDLFYTREMPRGGVLVVAEGEADLGRRFTLSTRDPIWFKFGTGRQVGQDSPTLWISEDVGDRLLKGTGYTVADLRLKGEKLEQDEVFQLSTEAVVSMQVQGTIHDKVPVRHVIGHMPGLSDSQYGGINNEVIVVLAQYDSPPSSPEGTFYPAANDNASGVAIMLEAIRTMQEMAYRPYRTFLFIAYSGEGLEGGEPVLPSDVSKFLQAKHGFSSNLEVKTIVHLRGLGAGEGEALTLAASGNRRIAALFQRAARQMGVRARPAKEPVDIGIVFEEKGAFEGGQEAPEIILYWENWEATARLSTDTLEAISTDKLDRAGRTLTLALMILGRELEY
jgi:ABC-type dipeptide/oligopeptide/nickel transport system permease component